MNKVLAEIIAGVIPYKMARNKWRGILRYGLFRAIKLKYRMKHDHTSPKYYLTICAIAKMKDLILKNGLNGIINKVLRSSIFMITKVQIAPKKYFHLI